MRNWLIILIAVCFLWSCQTKLNHSIKADILIANGIVYTGGLNEGAVMDLAICGEKICFIGTDSSAINASKVINARGMVLTPGFIDPHTHSLEELLSESSNDNLNYLSQGVTTVIVGNDGEGSFKVKELKEKLLANGIGTNVGLLVGHGNIRQEVMGLSDKAPTQEQSKSMARLLEQALEDGALGFSTGLYYVPGSYASSKEVIELAKVTAKHGKIYDTHIRDESTFNVGFLNAIREVLKIAKEANVRVHIAHIKALGVDVWGQSQQAIKIIQQGINEGLEISADQYPWRASGTFLHNAVIPPWVMADSEEAFLKRLTNKELAKKIKMEISENIRRRGGAKSLLVTHSKNKAWQGKNLQQISELMNLNVVETVISMTLQEKVRVASFNMSVDDIKAFMQQSWVVSSSDGTNGHPRKYASFPKKYWSYVKEKGWLNLREFIRKSSSQTASIFNIDRRGQLKVGFFADINVIDLEQFKARADFSNWKELSKGVIYQTINGVITIDNQSSIRALSGKVL